MIKLRVDDETAIPLSVDSSSAVSMTVSEAFIDRGGSAIQNNKNATPSTSQVVVTPDPGYDAMAKVTVAAIPPEYIIPSGTKSITANGEDQDVRQYEYVDVNVPGIVPTGTKTITTNGTHDVTDYASASVAVPASAVDSGTKSITANGNGQDVVGYAAVNVNVPNSYAAADEGKVVSNGALVAQSSQNIDTNGTYDTTLKNEVVVNVSGGGSYDWSWVKDDGYTYFYIDVDENWKEFKIKFGLQKNKSATIDWGDGNTDTETTGGVKSHTYTSAGSYVVKLQQSDVGAVNFAREIIGGDNTKAEQPIKMMLKKMEWGNSPMIENNTLRGCYALEALAYMATSTVDTILAYTGLTDLFSLKHLKQKAQNKKRVGATNSLITEWDDNAADSEVMATMTGNRLLKSLTIGNKIALVTAFSDCWSLETVTFTPTSSVTTLNSSVFARCYNLKRLEIPEGVATIPNQAFDACSSLEYISLPSTVTNMNNSNSFRGCYRMVELHIKATSVPPLASGAFDAFASLCKIYVPYSADHSVLTAYQTASNWSAYSSMIVEETP